MYDDHFGLKETPFSIAPDPRFLYMSDRHREALAHLIYGVGTNGGFILLTGEVGTGKTTISRCLLEQIPDVSNVALILNPKMIASELLATICDELHIEYPPNNTSIKIFVDCINRFLLENNAQGRKTVVIIEEAQNLEVDVLEQLRLLTNLETNQRKLLQIIMLGQPELLDILAKPELRQLEQRITARYHLMPLTQKETPGYIRHRLAVAGIKENLFTSAALKKIFQLSEGVPRKINLLCDRSLLGAYVQNQKLVDSKVVKNAAKEILSSRRSEQGRGFVSAKWIAWSAVVLALIVGGGGLATAYYKKDIDVKAPLVEQQSPNQQSVPVPQQPDVPATTQTPANSQADNEVLSFIDERARLYDANNAYRVMFDAWRIKYKEGSPLSACDQSKIYGLRCLHRKGNMRSLRMLNRPAILNLLNRKGEEVFLPVIRISNEDAIIDINGRFDVIRLQDLDARWFGDYTVLWQVPRGFADAIKPGDKGKVVGWLSQKIDIIRGTSITSRRIKSRRYDDEMVAVVKKLQGKVGLMSNGIAGAQTLIHINSATDTNVPKLDENIGVYTLK